MTFTITITRDEDGVYIAECPAIPYQQRGSGMTIDLCKRRLSQ